MISRNQSPTDAALDRIMLAVSQLSTKVDSYFLKLMQTITKPVTLETKVMAMLSDIEAAVAAETTVEGAVITLLEQLSMDLQAAIASEDPVAMQAVVDELAANTKKLSDAVTANTPVAPTPAPNPTPPTTP